MRDAILVTGVGKRTGLFLAREFSRRGIPVIGTYRHERASIDELRSSGVALHRCDFNQQQQLDRFIEAIGTHCTSLRAIIHNASDWLAEDVELPPEEVMQRMWQVHVSAPYRINLALAPLLQAHESGQADIIHIGDFVSSRGSRRHIAYAASKAAQDNLTLSFAARLAPRIKVNSIAPALVMFNEQDGERYREQARRKNLLQREGGVEELLHAIDYLLASSYVTGRILPVDGGRHVA